MQKLMPTGKGPCHARLSTTSLKARIALQGAAGSGKTYSALLLAHGLCQDYSKVTVLETSHRAIDHYRYFGPFQVVHIEAPFHTEKFLDAVERCESSGIEVIILDTLSAEWIGSGGIKDRLSQGEDCLHYHEALMDAIRQSPAHIIATLKTTEQYEVVTYKGKRIVEKLGFMPLQEEGIHYHFDTVLALDSKHKTTCLKDRTSFSEEHQRIIITEDIAALFPKWLNKQAPEPISAGVTQQAIIRNF